MRALPPVFLNGITVFRNTTGKGSVARRSDFVRTSVSRTYLVVTHLVTSLLLLLLLLNYYSMGPVYATGEPTGAVLTYRVRRSTLMRWRTVELTLDCLSQQSFRRVVPEYN